MCAVTAWIRSQKIISDGGNLEIYLTGVNHRSSRNEGEHLRRSCHRGQCWRGQRFMQHGFQQAIVIRFCGYELTFQLIA